MPFAREYGGLLDNRSFGGAQVSRTFYARGQTGQQLLLGAYQSMLRQVDAGTVTLFPRREMLDLVVADGQARGIVTRNLITGELERHEGQAVLLCTGGYGTVYYLSTNAVNSNVTAAWRAHKRGALFANPCFTQIHPTCIPVSGDHQSKLTLMSESLRNDGRVWVPKKKGDTRPPDQIPEAERDYYLERRYPSFGNLVPRDVASRAAKQQSDEGFGVGDTGLSVYLDFKEAIDRLGIETIKARYGNLFEMYERITAEDPVQGADADLSRHPLHDGRALGGLQPREHHSRACSCMGEANFSDHGANRLGASALMQGLADGYFIAPYTVANYLASAKLPKVSTDHDAFKEAASTAQARIDKVLASKASAPSGSSIASSAASCGTTSAWRAPQTGLKEALQKIRALRGEFWQDVVVSGEKNNLNPMLDYAGRVADYMEFGELLTLDALHRNESCGGHFREEFQTPDGEALRDDERYSYVAAWEFTGVDSEARLHKEPLVFDEVHPSQRSYK